MLNLAFSGQVKGVLGGPPCRTRSKLRHIEVDGIPNMPRPVRGWDGEELGIHDIKDQEDPQVFKDDVLMFRCRMIWIVAQEVRKIMGHDQLVAFGMEKPARKEDAGGSDHLEDRPMEEVGFHLWL